jgi:uncharacterized protein (DUF302 family)
MSYYYARIVDLPFDKAIERLTAALAKQGFGILTDIDIAATMKKKLGKEMPAYRILGACNPKLADRALTIENKIGTMLPCNVIVRRAEGEKIEIAAINPASSMSAVGNPGLDEIAGEVASLLRTAVDSV